MAGWISLHRSIEEHWLFKDERTFSKFEAWIDLLLMVNHKDKKILLGNELILVKRGQKITSIRKLCERWKWSNNKVKKFLNLLESDGMLIVKSDSKKTLLTVVNYDVYQNEDLEKRRKSDSKATRSHLDSDANASRMHTNNNVNKDNNVNNDNKVISSSNNDDFKTVVSMYQENIELNPAPVTFQKIQQDFNDYGKDIMLYAIEKSALKNNHNYSFINYLLNDWKKKQLTTVDEIKQSEHNFEFKKQATYSNQPQSKEITPSWINQENTQKQDIDEEELERERQKLLEELNSNWEDNE